jgi:protease-4
MLFEAPELRASRPSIAVINASGPITGGRSGNGGGLFGGETIGSRTLEEVLGDARDDDMIKGVVLRIDSPGGSAMASEVIWQALRNLGDEKPLYVSIGSTAASGGYYMACAGEKIYVSPSSIVGSIGVVGGKIVLGGLYEKIGLNVTRRSRGPMGDMFNSVEGFTPEQRVVLEAAFKRTYDQFTDRVSITRGKKIKDMSAVAQGRVFTGKQAVQNGLADAVGGVDTAVVDLAKQLKLKPGTYDVVNLPAPMSLGEYLEGLFGGMAAGASGDDQATLRAARTLLGERTWRSVQQSMNGVMLMQREPVLTVMPAVVVIK